MRTCRLKEGNRFVITPLEERILRSNTKFKLPLITISNQEIDIVKEILPSFQNYKQDECDKLMQPERQQLT